MASTTDPDVSCSTRTPSALTCTICNLPAKDCARCRSAAYCSPTCQNLDWPLHKTLCKKFTATPPRPSLAHKLGILFPPDSTSPKLVWVNFVKTKFTEIEGLFDVPNVSEFLTYGPSDRFDPEQLLIEPQRIMREQNIDHTLAVYMRDNFGADGSKMTQSASSITGGKMTHDWKGPLVILSMEGQSIPRTRELKIEGMTVLRTSAGLAFQGSMDVTLKDLRIVLDYFLAYPYELERGLHLRDLNGNRL
ncbi:hypothetical protein SBOR_2636 [Sclerotinia borealis F-4128]|uniref:MYND-type domain-containing protein n=1 Tax=Sclerotinia borealis (strain F-4128) TaxID=1432307 RepID=W9CQS0_SCLBF|nr:hypothetical protein SBOR_2636 [Sclerotinia borealis F-4128]